MTDRLLTVAAVGFEAAREVSSLPEGHRSRRLHGHSFIARARAELAPGWAAFPGAEVDDLTARLSMAAAPLDYRLLNGLLAQPTDENLARWLRENLGVPGLVQVGIQSTPDEGVEIDAHNHAHVWRRYRFESAHFLPHVQVGHKCGRLHGHGFEVILHADQDVSTRDLGVDYDYLDVLWAPLHERLHHRCLNDIAGLENPTSEIIASWVWSQLKPLLPELSWVTCFETGTSGAQYDGSTYRIWKELTFDSAARLVHAPLGDSRGRVHGHTFTLRLHLSAPLNEVMGWTIDFGDVKQLFEPLFKKLDHQPLHELVGAVDSDTASLARWIRKEADGALPALDRVDVYQTRGCGSLLNWGINGPSLPA